MADFILECTIPEEGPEAEIEVGKSDECWILHIDGSSNTMGSGLGLILTHPKGVVAKYVLRFGFQISNNEAEYEVLVTGLKIAKKIRVWHMRVYSNSQLVVEQV